jgi:phage replication initiation protein
MDFSDSILPWSEGPRSGAGAEGERVSADRRTAPAPRVVTTGRKNGKPLPVDLDSGDWVELVASRRGIGAVLHPPTNEAVPSSAAIIDAVAFSIVPPDEQSYTWVLEHLRRFVAFEGIEVRRGLYGFRHSARLSDGVGVIAWGGESQRGRVYVSLMGKGCSQVEDWCGFASWLELHRAALKRADVAHDDHEGKTVNIKWAVDQYQGDGFSTGGRRPAHDTAGDWLSGDGASKGRTLYVGNRASGKLCRVYEKGKQLGDPSCTWTRVEVEWHAQDRHIPYDILTRPGHYLAGAYPCLAFLSAEQSRIKTIAKGAQIAFDRAIENAKQHCGKLVNLALEVFQGDYAEVVSKLIRPGYPGRIDPFSYHVRRDPSMLDPGLQGAL